MKERGFTTVTRTEQDGNFVHDEGDGDHNSAAVLYLSPDDIVDECICEGDFDAAYRMADLLFRLTYRLPHTPQQLAHVIALRDHITARRLEAQRPQVVVMPPMPSAPHAATAASSLLVPTERMPAYLDEPTARQIYAFLNREGCIDPDTAEAHFLWLMGAATTCPPSVQPVRWLRNRQLLREMLEHAFAPLLDAGRLSKAQLARLVPAVFIDRKGQPLHLSNNRHEPSTVSDKIDLFFRQLHASF